MTMIWKTVILLATVVAAAHCLVCNLSIREPLDLSFLNTNITCDNATQSCFQGEARLNVSGSPTLVIRSCINTGLCGPLSGNIFGVSYTANLTCCNTNLCNSARSFQISLLMAVCTAIFSLQAV